MRKIKLHPLRSRYLLLLIPVLAIVASLLFLFLRSSPLVTISSNAQFGITATCTFGTNHVYYYGDPVDRVLDPIIRRGSNTNAYRLRVQTTEVTTVVWVRLENPSFANPPPLVASATGLVRMPTPDALRQFQARLIEVGGDSLLDLKSSLQHYKGSYCVGGWLLPRSLQAHRDSVLRIESTNGAEIVTLRIP